MALAVTASSRPRGAVEAGTRRGDPSSGTGSSPGTTADTATDWPSARWWATAKRHGPPSGSVWSARAYAHSRPSTSTRRLTGPVTSSPLTRPQMVASVTASSQPVGIGGTSSSRHWPGIAGSYQLRGPRPSPPGYRPSRAW